MPAAIDEQGRISDDSGGNLMTPGETRVIHFFYSGPSGASAVAVSLAVRLAGRLPQEAILYGVPAPRETYVRALDERAVPWRHTPKAPGPRPDAYARAARLLAARARGGGILIVHGLQLFPVLAALRLWPRRVPVVGYVHGPTEELRGPGIWRALGSVWLADHLICVTEELRRLVGRLPLCGRAARGAALVTNGVDADFWRPAPARRPPEPRELRLCFSGALTARKRAGLALDALAELRRQGVAGRLEICGDGPERIRLQRRAAALGLQGAVVFRGLLAPDLLRDTLASSHVLIHPSRSEGLSLAVLEALACGCPVVLCPEARARAAATGIGPETGVAIAAEATAGGLAAAVRTFVDQPGAWAGQADTARRAVLAGFGVDEQAERFLAALRGWWPGIAPAEQGAARPRLAP